MNTIIKYLNQLKVTFLGLSRPQKILSAGAAAILLASLAFLVYSINRVEYAPLYSGLSQEDEAAVIESLKTGKIPYKLSERGTISVPSKNVHETRLAMATEGVPKGGGVGFEIFDQQKLGSSEFVQKINYQRALQGELARTINTLDEVQESRVHLVLPEESLFVQDQKPPGASVVLKLRPGARLDSKKSQGIVRLIAGAVQGMEEENVTILSTDGQVIFKKDGQDTPFQMTNAQMELKSRVEESLHRKVQSMLEQVLGAGKVITRVTAELDFSQIQVAEDSYDPDSAVVRSQQRSIENSDGKEPGARGNPDVPINIESKLLQNEPQQGTAGDKESRKSFNRQRETVNYEINRISRQITQVPGNLERISVAVIVDGNYEMRPDQNGNVKPVFVGRSPEDMKSVEEIVKKAVGYDEGRGDQIAVSNTPFATELADFGTAPESRWLTILKSYQYVLLNLLLILVVILFIVRPLMRRFQLMGIGSKKPADSVPALPGGEEGLPGALPSLLQGESKPSLRREVAAMVLRDPEKATEIIQAWLRKEG